MTVCECNIYVIADPKVKYVEKIWSKCKVKLIDSLIGHRCHYLQTKFFDRGTIKLLNMKDPQMLLVHVHFWTKLDFTFFLEMIDIIAHVNDLKRQTELLR